MLDDVLEYWKNHRYGIGYEDINAVQDWLEELQRPGELFTGRSIMRTRMSLDSAGGYTENYEIHRKK